MKKLLLASMIAVASMVAIAPAGARPSRTIRCLSSGLAR